MSHSKNQLSLFVALASTLCTLATAPADETPSAPIRKLTNGDRVVFLGDSITAGGIGKGRYITLISDQAKANNLEIECIGAGVSGNKVPNLQKRLDKDVLVHKPTVVVIFIGVNDVWHQDTGKGTSRQDYAAGLKDLITRIRAAKAEPILCTPGVIGEKIHWDPADMKPPPPPAAPKKKGKLLGIGQLASILDEYSEISRRIAREQKVPLVDLHAAFLKYIALNNRENKINGILTKDNVHPNPTGSRLIAEQIGTALGIKF